MPPKKNKSSTKSRKGKAGRKGKPNAVQVFSRTADDENVKHLYLIIYGFVETDVSHMLRRKLIRKVHLSLGESEKNEIENVEIQRLEGAILRTM